MCHRLRSEPSSVHDKAHYSVDYGMNHMMIACYRYNIVCGNSGSTICQDFSFYIYKKNRPPHMYSTRRLNNIESNINYQSINVATTLEIIDRTHLNEILSEQNYLTRSWNNLNIILKNRLP